MMVAFFHKGKIGMPYSWWCPFLAVGAFVFLYFERNLIIDLAQNKEIISIYVGSGIYLGFVAAVLSFIGGFIPVW